MPVKVSARSLERKVRTFTGSSASAETPGPSAADAAVSFEKRYTEVQASEMRSSAVPTRFASDAECSRGSCPLLSISRIVSTRTSSNMKKPWPVRVDVRCPWERLGCGSSSSVPQPGLGKARSYAVLGLSA